MKQDVVETCPLVPRELRSLIFIVIASWPSYINAEHFSFALSSYPLKDLTRCTCSCSSALVEAAAVLFSLQGDKKMQSVFLAERSRGTPGQVGRTGHSMCLMQGLSSPDVEQPGTGTWKLLGLG